MRLIHKFVQGSEPLTLLLLHGTGGDENDLIPLGQSLAPLANLLSPRGNVLEQGMPRFFKRLAPGIFDTEDLKERTHELAEFIEQAALTYGLAKDLIVAVGYSNGANIAASLLLMYPGALRAAALLHAMVPFESAEPISLDGLPVLLTAGEDDTMVPAESTAHLAQLLRDAGAAVRMELLPGGHALTRDEMRILGEWLHTLPFLKAT